MDKTKPDNARTGIRPGVILAVVAVVGILIAGKFAGWFGGQKQNASETTAGQAPSGVESVSSPAQTAPGANPSFTPGVRSPTPVRGTPSGAPGIASTVPGPRSPTTPPGAIAPATAVPEANVEMADWNEKLDNILGSNGEEAQKAEQLLALWPTLPEEGQVETMQHISNLLPDEKFSLLAQTLTNAATAEAVLDIIMSDALNRPNALKLPSLLEVAKVPGHPKAEEAREILEIFVDHEYGADWAQWDKAVKDWLKENPDEPDPQN